MVPLWPPRLQMALIALIASCLGAAGAMGMLAWGIHILWRGGWAATTQVQRIAAIAYISYGLLGLAFVTITAMGFAINRRRIMVNGPGDTSVSLDGGEPDPGATVTTTTTETVVKPE